jgi:uncharacterized integral membrane protein (TIGR00698 family)
MSKQKNKKDHVFYEDFKSEGGDVDLDRNSFSYVSRWSEDIWSLVIGGFIIASILLFVSIFPGIKLPLPVFQWADTDELFSRVITYQNLALLSFIGCIYLLLSALAIWMGGVSIRKYTFGYLLLYILAIFSLIIAGNKTINGYSLEYVIFALVFGLLAGNLFVLPDWIKNAARSEFYIKTGLVILGTSVLFSDIIKAGLPGILQAVAVVLVVWFFALWLSRKLKVDDEFAVILASAVSICGVSAAIVASGVINGDKKKLSYITTLVILVAIPMLIMQPWLIKYFEIPEIIGGAWLGGTLDTTASVTAAAQLVGPQALKAGVIIKFSQNVLIGVAAFLIAGWWALRNDKTQNGKVEKVTGKVIWDRFPKFVLGFIAASLIFSFFIPSDIIKHTSGILNSLRTIWFAIAFVSIGLEARFVDLAKIQGGRPALAFVGAQVFNILWTLLWAYILFSGILFDVPDLK